MRQLITRLHRWAGLLTAAFLFTSGVTGAVIAWDHAIDEWLNPHFFRAVTALPARPAPELVSMIEQRDPRVQVVNMQVTAEPSGSLTFLMLPRIDPSTGKRFALEYNQVFVDPGSGDELGRRSLLTFWPVTRENVMRFLYRFHHTLLVPEFAGSSRWGARFLGVVAIVWTLDCIVGFYLTLPPRRKHHAMRPAAVSRELDRGFWARWKPAWLIKASGSAYRLNFDVHRAFGLWTWGALFILAFTGFSLNLNLEVFSPLLKTVSDYTPTPIELRQPAPADRPIAPKLSFADVIARGNAEAAARGWREPVGNVFYARAYGIYVARFFAPGDDHGDGGFGPRSLFFDALDGRILGDKLPWMGTAADVFAQAQFPMHSGRILGLPGRILISLMGLVVAALSVTGVVIWWRKRRARTKRRIRAAPARRAVTTAE